MRSSGDEAMELLKSWSAGKTRLTLWFTSRGTGVELPRTDVAFFARLSDNDEKLWLETDDWGLWFSLLSARELLTLRMAGTEEVESVLVRLAETNLHLALFKPPDKTVLLQ